MGCQNSNHMNPSVVMQQNVWSIHLCQQIIACTMDICLILPNTPKGGKCHVSKPGALNGLQNSCSRIGMCTHNCPQIHTHNSCWSIQWPRRVEAWKVSTTAVSVFRNSSVKMVHSPIESNSGCRAGRSPTICSKSCQNISNHGLQPATGLYSWPTSAAIVFVPWCNVPVRTWVTVGTLCDIVQCTAASPIFFCGFATRECEGPSEIALAHQSSLSNVMHQWPRLASLKQNHNSTSASTSCSHFRAWWSRPASWKCLSFQ